MGGKGGRWDEGERGKKTGGDLSSAFSFY